MAKPKQVTTTTTNTPAVVAATNSNPTYNLSAQAALVAAGAGNTLQNAKSGLGKAWRTTAQAKPNTRTSALQAIAAIPAPFTLAQAQSALATLHSAGTLGSGTPRSYCVAFVKNGYFALQA